MAKVLVVEDDPSLALVIQSQLEREKHLAELASDGNDAISLLKVYHYDLVILDWGLPGLSGVEVLRRYRERGGAAPVLMLTGRATGQDRVEGLDSGADDYLTKPFLPEELSARVRALLRRPAQMIPRVLKVRDIELDPSTYRVLRGEKPCELLPKEFAILELLMRYPNQYFTPDAILDRLWKSDSSGSVESIRTHMRSIRHKLGDSDDNPLIKTVRGLGYKINE